MDKASLIFLGLMTPRSSMVEQAPYKRPIWVQFPAGQPAGSLDIVVPVVDIARTRTKCPEDRVVETERFLLELPCTFSLTFCFISGIVLVIIMEY